jgi:hypothetical protein
MVLTIWLAPANIRHFIQEMDFVSRQDSGLWCTNRNSLEISGLVLHKRGGTGLDLGLHPIPTTLRAVWTRSRQFVGSVRRIGAIQQLDIAPGKKRIGQKKPNSDEV